MFILIHYIIGLFIFCIIFISFPEKLIKDPTSTVVTGSKGELLGARIAKDEQWRFPEIDSVPDKFKTAVLLFEDRYFYKHPGINPVALARAAVYNIRSGKIVSGGSTITMQLMRISRKGKPRNIAQKTIEMVLAICFEFKYPKEYILKLYSSHAPFGGNVVGLEAASWRYFNHDPWALSWAEAAMLAILPNAPSLVHPGKNRELLLKKRNTLLKKLFETGNIDSVTYSLSIIEPIPDKPLLLPDYAYHLIERINTQLPGYKTKTTLDLVIQQNLQHLLEINKFNLYDKQVHNLACIVIENKTGNVIAYAGNLRNSEHPEYGGDVDIIHSPRSTGSIMKPLLFAYMLDRGEILPGTLVPDIPTHYRNFSPKNFDRGYDGAVSAKRALERSLNVPSVRMLRDYGVDRFYHDLKRLGISTLPRNSDHYGLSLILGGAEATLWDLTGVYSSMARVLNTYLMSGGKYYRGDHRKPSILSDVSPVHHHIPEEQGVLGAGAIYLTFKSLLEVNRPSSETGWEYFSSSRPIAWKTGTSFGFRDAWAIGTTPEYVVGVWAGNASGEGKPGLTGINVAAPVMFEVFNFLPATTWFRIPYDDLVQAEVCLKSGQKSSFNCPERDTIWITPSGLTTPACKYHETVHLSADGRFRVNSSCHEPAEMIQKAWFVLPPAMEYYYKFRDPSYRILPPVMDGCIENKSIEHMQLIYPEKNAVIYIPYEFGGTKSRMVCEATHRYPEKRIFWHLDDEYLGATEHIHQMAVLTGKGKHVLTLVDAAGEKLTISFEIVDRD